MSGARYLDGSRRRAALAQRSGCGRSGWCALQHHHAGRCDPRPESERAQVLTQLLAKGFRGAALTAAVEASAAAAMRRALAAARVPLATGWVALPAGDQ